MPRKLWRWCMTTRLAISTSKLARGDGGHRASVLLWPNWFEKLLVSPDQCHPTSLARTTRRVRVRCQTSSGFLRSFLRRATTVAATSTCATLALGETSQCKTGTSVVSIVKCAHPNKGSPSATISSRQAQLFTFRELQDIRILRILACFSKES